MSTCRWMFPAFSLVLTVFVSFVSAADTETGGILPDFEGALISGGVFQLSDHIGKDMIVLNFFTTNCGPCREEMPKLEAYNAEHKDKHFVLLGIDVEENPAKVKNLLDYLKITYPVTVDAGELTKALQVIGYPTTIIIGVDGSIQYSYLGVIDVATVLDKLQEKNNTLLAGDGSISRDAFLRRQKEAGLSLIKLTPPEAKPVKGYSADTAKPNEIFSITVAEGTLQSLKVDVDYNYAGDHGDKRIYIDCDARTSDGASPLGMLPVTAQVGHHVARAPMQCRFTTHCFHKRRRRNL